MSIMHTCDDGWVVSHDDYVKRIYHGKHRLKPSLFNIIHPYKITKKKQTKNLLDKQILDIQEKCINLISDARKNNIFNNAAEELDTDNDKNNDALLTADECTGKTITLQNMCNIKGGNTSSNTVYHQINNCDLLIPKSCRFICGDVRLTLSNIDEKQFDLVILDPPWWNKYIRRKKAKNPGSSYQMLYNDEVANLPIGSLLSNEAIVAVWCTNCNNHENDIKDKMFPAWGIKYAATWFWMKVTKSGDPVCPFSKLNGKQPFERLLLGVKDNNENCLPDGKIFMSIPSALHSHKPPLNDLLSPYLKDSPKCLEVFARYLLPKTTSVGLEPLRWQHMSLYTTDTKNEDDDS